MNPEQAFQEKAHLFTTCNHLLSKSKLDDKSAAKLIGCTVRKIENLKSGQFKKIDDLWLEKANSILEKHNENGYMFCVVCGNTEGFPETKTHEPTDHTCLNCKN